MGFLEAQAYRDGVVPECDRSLWTITVGQPRRTVRVRFGGGRKAVCDDPDVCAVAAAGTESDVRTVVAVTLPATALGVERLAAGTSVALDVSLDTAGRCDHVRWKARLTLR